VRRALGLLPVEQDDRAFSNAASRAAVAFMSAPQQQMPKPSLA